MIELMEKPPEGMIEWIQEQKDIQWEDYLVYRAGRYRDPLTGLSEKCVDAVCTACGEHMKLTHVPGPECAGYAPAPFGFGWTDKDGQHESISGQKIHCPRCGKKVTARHIGSIRNAERYAWVMTADKAPGLFILYLWRVRRWADKNGIIFWDAVPWEAYAFGEKNTVKYVHWMKNIGYSIIILSEWKERKRFTDTAYDCDIVYCPEGLGAAAMGTPMENSKLELYMGIEDEYRFPVTWLKIYQRHHNAETLMTCRAAKLVAGMIARDKQEYGNYRSRFNEKTDLLNALDWKQKRPWDILRIQKEELDYFDKQARKDGADRLEAVVLARKSDVKVRPGEEQPGWCGGIARRFLEKGIHPEKAARYIQRQKKKYPKESVYDSDLLDHWSMAKALGMDLKDPDVRWPQHFHTEHQRLSELLRIKRDEELKRRKAAEIAARAEKFRKRFERMSQYSWERDGILIRPAETEEELIAEGKTLHHCVGTYAKRHASGNLTIFFIRHANRPDEPWFTLNFNEKTMSVTENRGKHNCDRTPEIKEFEAAWLEWVRAGCKDIKEEKAA